MHVGVSGIATELHLEQQAHNDGYERLDNCGTCPEKKCCVDDAEDCLVSGINMEKVCQCVNEADIKIKASVSHDPGRCVLQFNALLCTILKSSMYMFNSELLANDSC